MPYKQGYKIIFSLNIVMNEMLMFSSYKTPVLICHMMISRRRRQKYIKLGILGVGKSRDVFYFILNLKLDELATECTFKSFNFAKCKIGF